MNTDHKPATGEFHGRQDDDLAVTEDDIAGYLKDHPGMAGMSGTLVDLAWRKARRRRPDLTDSEFATLATQSIPGLSWHQGTMAAEILAYIQAYRPAPRPPGQPGAPSIDEDACQKEVRVAVESLIARGYKRPTRAAIAEEIGIDPRTFRTWRRRFPGLNSLLPK